MLGDNIRKFRKKAGYSQEQIAENLGVSRQSISLWENNQTQPSIDNIVALAKVFGINTDDLLLNSEKKAEEKFCGDFANIEENETPKPKRNKRMILWCGIVLAIIIGAVLTLFFIRNTNQQRLKNADTAVVKIICYDQLDNVISTGSGFFYEGFHLVTNYHVIEDAYKIVCVTSDDVAHDVEYIYYYSESMDLAVIVPQDVDYEVSTSLERSKEKIEKGTQVYAIGSPLGIQNTLSEGIISGRHLVNGIDAIQFTASISSGSSGGALLDEKGRVLGITFASYEEGQNLNLALPIDLLDSACPEWNNSMALPVSTHYIDTHKYGKDLEFLKKLTENNIEIATLEDLKNNMDSYKGKTVAINTYISSISDPIAEDPITYLYAVCNKKDITYNFENDFTDFDNNSATKSVYVLVRGSFEENDRKETLTAGENVWVICSNVNDENDVLTLLMMYNAQTQEYVSVVPTLVNLLKEKQ